MLLFPTRVLRSIFRRRDESRAIGLEGSIIFKMFITILLKFWNYILQSLESLRFSYNFLLFITVRFKAYWDLGERKQDNPNF